MPKLMIFVDPANMGGTTMSSSDSSIEMHLNMGWPISGNGPGAVWNNISIPTASLILENDTRAWPSGWN